MRLRIYADFNSGGANPDAGPCWCLRYGDPLRPLDEFEAELGLHSGQVVTLYYEDPAEEFEVEAVLEEDQRLPKWQALPDWSTMRRLRG